MENFIVSARKYRPASFDMVVGQDTITNTLKSAIRNKHLAHAYLFCGPRGVGKTTCARIFAKTINCINLGPDGDACDKCESCISFSSQRSFNIHELDAASNNKVEDIRSLNDQVRIPPQVGKYSIYIIDEVHMLSSSAFNAFLKTLEEPPPHAIFILATTEKHKIIPTILSRCQIFDFNRIRIEDIVNRLQFVAKNEGIEAEEEALHVIGQKADGAMRDALSIFDQIVSLCGKSITYKNVIENLNVLDYEYFFKTIQGALEGNVSSVLLTFNEILEKGFDGHNFISGLNSHLRDLLVCKDESTIKLLEATPAIRQLYLKQTASASSDFLFRSLETGSACELSYKASKNPRLHVELALIRLCRINAESYGDLEKKKSEQVINQEEELPVPSRSNTVRQIEKTSEDVRAVEPAQKPVHEPKIEKQVRSVSIKDLLNGGNQSPDPGHTDKPGSFSGISERQAADLQVLTPELLEKSWADFTELLNGEGPRIVSMFKAISPVLENNKTIIIHLSNATQKDTFVQYYKQRLINHLERKYIMNEIDIETVVDVNETNNTIYSDEQKYNYLFNKYPILKEVKKSFNLDLN